MSRWDDALLAGTGPMGPLTEIPHGDQGGDFSLGFDQARLAKSVARGGIILRCPRGHAGDDVGFKWNNH